MSEDAPRRTRGVGIGLSAQPWETGLEVAELAEKEPGAAGAIVACMLANSAHTAWVENAVLSMVEAERDKWKARALAAERHNDQIARRVVSLLAYDPLEEEDDLP